MSFSPQHVFSSLGVAQSFTLPYRRVVLGTPSEHISAFRLSSDPQSATLRYDGVVRRLKM